MIKKSLFFVPLSLLGLSLVSCDSGTEVVTNFTTTTTSTSSAVEEISNAITELKKGFNATIDFKGSFIEDGYYYSYQYPGQFLYKNTEEEKLLASRNLDYDAYGNVVDNNSSFTYYGGDSDGLLYQKSLNYKNEVYNNYSTTDSMYFNALFSNPFEMLNIYNVSKGEDGTYLIVESYARTICTWFGIDLSYFSQRKFESAYFTVANDEFDSFNVVYKGIRYGQAILSCVLNVSFTDTGSDYTYNELKPLEDDGTDKTNLKNAFEKLDVDNFTLDYKLTPGAMNMVSGSGSKYYFTGDKVYLDNDTYYSVPGLSTGDVLFTLPNNSKTVNMDVRTYNETSKTFNLVTGSDLSNVYKVSYNDLLPLISDINLAFFTTEDGGNTYKVRSGYASSVFAQFLPKTLYSDLMVNNAKDITITFNDSGLPIINMTFFYDLGGDGSFGEYETITLKYTNAGDTQLPDEVVSTL